MRRVALAWLRFWLALFGTSLCALAFSGCDAHGSSDGAANRFMSLEQNFVLLKQSWIEADLALLNQGCRGLRPALRARLSQTGNEPGVADFDSRKTSCRGVAELQSTLKNLIQNSATINSGDAFEELQNKLSDLRTQTDTTVKQFPTASFGESNFPPAAASEFRAKHEALARDAGRLAAEAVDAARTASRSAVAQSKSSDHELDKARARLSDEAYTHASADLSQMSSLSDASEIVAQADHVFSDVDGAIGSAQGTGRAGGNPVTAADEAVPSVAPSAFSTPEATQAAPAAASQQQSGSNNQGANGIIYGTSEIQVLGTDGKGCDGASGLFIRFKDDGTSGCASTSNSIRAHLDSGSNVVLIPVNASGKGTVFDLLYLDTGARVRFLGILPGDGSGNLSVGIENGMILEQNGDKKKYSTVRGGRVVAM